ncbi:MAG: NAD(P)/FAD-dependent oxidoreductase [Chloroflexi bacterium]|nr:NAD(P)/FAD-dependent oxidoreductase [Chloroflexota bacterium]
MTTNQDHVVVVGGGFGGLHLAKSLKRVPVRVTLIDKRNFHLFQPLLYQVATGALSPGDIASPIRAILSRQANVKVLLGEVTAIDVANQRVLLKDTNGGDSVAYDTLVLATGLTHFYFGNDQWADIAPGLKTVEDALSIRARILYAFEAAERETDPAMIQEWLTFVVVGGGPTGVEMAGAIGEIANYTLRHNFRAINPATATIYLVEGTGRVLPPYRPRLSARAKRDLEKLGVTVRVNTLVTDVRPDRVTLTSGDKSDIISTRTVVWAAGLQGTPLGRQIAEATGAEVDRIGRVIVAPDCSVPGYPNLFVIGDLAHFNHGREQPLPGVAQVATQQATYVAKLLQHRLKGSELDRSFRYRDLGSMATIGRAAAVADLGWIRLTGYLGWLIWLFVHLMKLVEFRNRISVFIQWAYNYITRNRSARLITREPTLVQEPELAMLTELEEV